MAADIKVYKSDSFGKDKKNTAFPYLGFTTCVCVLKKYEQIQHETYLLL